MEKYIGTKIIAAEPAVKIGGKIYLLNKQVDGSHSMWVPSIGDVLAEDWGIIK